MSVKRMSLQEVLQRLGGRAIFQQIAEHIQTVAHATGQTGGKGKLTITIETSKTKGSTIDDPMIQFKTQLVPKLPAAPAKVTHLYVSEDGLHSDDPRQVPMEFRVVENEAADIRQADDTRPNVREA